MSILADLLHAKDDSFDLALRQLEDHTGRVGVDADLLGEIMEKAHQAAYELGLEQDFNGPELYQALMRRIGADNERIGKKVGGENLQDLDEMIPKLVDTATNLDMPKDCWVLKKEVAADMLRKMPPKNVMKILGRRKVKTLLEHEDLYEVYGALRFAEDGDWLNEFIELYKELKPEDFESREIEVISYDADKWGNVAEDFIEKKLHNVTHLKELGVILTMPVDESSSMSGTGITLKVLPLLVHYYNEIRLYSAYFKLIQDKDNFGELIVDTLIADTPNTSLIEDNKIGWRVIQRYYGKLPKQSHPEMFEPHVHPEDLHYRKTEAILYDFDPELEFWKDMDYVGLLLDGEVLTYNFMDVSLSYANELSFPERYVYHFRESLWNEIFMRYMGKETLEERILMKLDNEIIRPETIPVERK